jgi:hypothetical protein
MLMIAQAEGDPVIAPGQLVTIIHNLNECRSCQKRKRGGTPVRLRAAVQMACPTANALG